MRDGKDCDGHSTVSLLSSSSSSSSSSSTDYFLYVGRSRRLTSRPLFDDPACKK